MDYFNDERYWDIKLLNKWFAISSILFFLSIIWMFIDDNDDQYKDYQKDFRKLSIEVEREKLENELAVVEGEREVYELENEQAQLALESQADILESLDEALVLADGDYYKANMEYLGHKASVDELKYLYEDQEVHSHDSDFHDNKYKQEYNEALEVSHGLKLIKEDKERALNNIKSKIKEIKAPSKLASDNLDKFLKKVSLVEKKLAELDRSQMSTANQIADIVRDLPIIDFMDPYYKVNQVVVNDVKYDVNFAAVQTVDRCTSCHLGIDNPDFEDAEQPFTTHPRLDLFLTSSSPHPVEEYGCSGCHAGRSRGTSFVSSVHMPKDLEQKKHWEKEYDWEKMHHWLKPMLPVQYSQAGCFKCHTNKPYLEGADKLSHGLALIQKNGCNGCHLMQNFAKRKDPGPDLSKLSMKTDKEWTMKWIKDPRSFRHNAKMPSFFGQDNNSDPASVRRADTEIFAMVEYLFKDDNDNSINSKKYIGDEDNGEVLFNAVGCTGCHIIAPEKTDLPDINNTYTLLSQQGPNLINLGSKTTSEWVYKWIKDPTSYWPDTKMPNLRLSDQEAKDITAYLMSFTDEEFEISESPEMNEDELDNIAIGWLKKMYPEVDAENKFNNMTYSDKVDYVADKSIRYYGCTGCHDIPGYEDSKPIGVELTYEGSKPVSKLDFGHIHDIDHTNYAWFEQKLRNPRIFDRDKVVDPEDKLRMPNFYFSDEEIEAIVTAILSFTEDKLSPEIIADRFTSKEALEGHRIIKDLNCQGCHMIEDFGGQIADQMELPEFAPPNLNTQGDKVHSEWLYHFLDDPTIIRPNLQVRMPTFNLSDKDLNSLIAAFQDIDDTDLIFEAFHSVDKNSDKYKSGKKLASADLGACNNCHFYGDTFPIQKDPKTWAPNLAMSKERLRSEWVVDWLRDPQKIMPGTKMPAPYIPGEYGELDSEDAKEIFGQSMVNIYDGVKNSTEKDSLNYYNKQIMLEGLRDYLFSIKGKSDISDIIRDYYKENGYKFNEEEEEEDDDDW